MRSPDDHLGALLERGDEARDLLEVVGEVGVGHDDVAAGGGGEAGEVGAAIAAPAFEHDAGAGLFGQARGVVLGVVVGDDDLAADTHRGDRLEGRAHAAWMFSASFRQGMTTETRGHGWLLPPSPSPARLCERVC